MMHGNRENFLLYAVTDRAWTGKQSLLEQVELALQGGVTCVQLREKELDPASFLEEAQKMHELCQQYAVPLIINDHVDVALACHAEGIHIGQDDLPPAEVRRRVGDSMILGVSAHSLQEARDAVKNGADYLGVGAVFATKTKTDTKPLPIETVREICAAVSVPVVAIGGIQKNNLLELTGTGIAGVALVRAIFGAADITAACRTLRHLAEAARDGAMRREMGGTKPVRKSRILTEDHEP